MNDVTFTVDERLIVAICDAALKNQGVQILQACGTVLNAIQQSKKGNGNAGQHSTADSRREGIDN